MGTLTRARYGCRVLLTDQCRSLARRRLTCSQKPHLSPSPFISPTSQNLPFTPPLTPLTSPDPRCHPPHSRGTSLSTPLLYLHPSFPCLSIVVFSNSIPHLDTLPLVRHPLLLKHLPSFLVLPSFFGSFFQLLTNPVIVSYCLPNKIHTFYCDIKTLSNMCP